MLKLVAKYIQNSSGTWDAYVIGYRQVVVEAAEDLETAKVILRIITAEELDSQRDRQRRNWDIIEEHIYHYNVNETEY